MYDVFHCLRQTFKANTCTDSRDLISFVKIKIPRRGGIFKVGSRK